MSRPWAAAVQDGIAAALNGRGAAHSCEPLTWSFSMATWSMRLTGQVSVMPLDPASVAARWAALLGLAPVEAPVCEGTIEYAGVVDSMPITVWAIVDRARFDVQDTGGSDR